MAIYYVGNRTGGQSVCEAGEGSCECVWVCCQLVYCFCPFMFGVWIIGLGAGQVFRFLSIITMAITLTGLRSQQHYDHTHTHTDTHTQHRKTHHAASLQRCVCVCV